MIHVAGKIVLEEVDELEVVSVMDNYADSLLPGSAVVKRFSTLAGGQIISDALFAEHGLSLLLRARRGDRESSILLDAGWSGEGTMHNLRLLKIDLSSIEAVVLSHGHMDHFGGLIRVIDAIGKKVPVVCHPGVFQNSRFRLMPDGRKIRFPLLEKEKLEAAGAQVVESKEPCLLGGDFFATTGEVARTTEFEQGAPNFFVEIGGAIEKDYVPDDQGIVVLVRGKGLVVVSGCAHAGIINTICQAREITGVERVYAVLGGFHLSGPHFEKIVAPTVQSLKNLGLQVLAPMHCTGWRTTHHLAREFEQAFILNSVGSVFKL